MKIGIVSDSSTGFTIEELEKYHEIIIMPLTIIDKEEEYNDNNIDIDSEMIYKKMINENHPLKTSQTSRGKLEQYWDMALNKYEQILFLPIANNASGQYSNSKILQQEEKYKDRVHIFETGAGTLPLKIMVLIALKLTKDNESIKKIKTILKKYCENYECFILPNDLKYVCRSGRVSKVTSSVINKLKIKTILRCKEKLTKVDISRTFEGAISKIFKLIKKLKYSPEDTLYILDGWCEKRIIEKVIVAAKNAGFIKFKIEYLCNVLKVHTGNNTIGLAIIRNSFIQLLE